MPCDVTHQPDLLLDVVQRPCGIEFNDAQALFFQQFPGRELGKTARDNDVGLQHQNILCRSREPQERVCLGGSP